MTALRVEVMPREVVRAMRKGRCRNAKATEARTLYALGLGVNEVVEVMRWKREQVLQALRRVP